MASVCAHCGSGQSTPDESQLRIKDLEAQVRLLNTKAAAAVDRLADYEDEIRTLRTSYAQLQQQQQIPQQKQLPSVPSEQAAPTPPPPDQAPTPPTPTTTTPTIPNPSSPPRNTSRLASLSSFLPGRRRDTALLQQPPNTPLSGLFPSTTSPYPGHSQSTSALLSRSLTEPITLETNDKSNPQSLALHTLQSSLEAERTLRLRAESDLTQTQSELEELTATLFGQANEMVAQERKARAKLEERVKVLEDRDGEKRRRLDRLEKALERIDRVRDLVRNEKRDPKVGVVEVRQDGQGDVDVGRLRVVNEVAVRN